MLAPRIAIEGDALIPHTYSHVGIRCKHSQCQRARFIEYPISALNQFGARIVACKEKGCGELDAMASSGNSLTTQIHVVRSPHHFCSALPRRADSQRCKPISLSNSQPDRLPCRHSIIRIEFRIPTLILLKSSPLREV